MVNICVQVNNVLKTILFLHHDLFFIFDVYLTLNILLQFCYFYYSIDQFVIKFKYENIIYYLVSFILIF